MTKTTKEGLPIITEDLYDEVLKENIQDIERTTREYNEKFLLTNGIIYRDLVMTLATSIYPNYARVILEDFPVGYELLRRAGERTGLSPELPIVSHRTFEEENNRNIEIPERSSKHIKIIKDENLVYLKWAMLSTEQIKESKDNEFINDFRNQQIFIYHLLRTQAIKDRQKATN